MAGTRKARIETNDLLNRTIIQRYGSIAAFCAKHGLNACYVGELINLKRSPLSKKGNWKKIPTNVANILAITPEELYPLKIYGLSADQCAKEQAFSSLSFSDWQRVQNFPQTDGWEITLRMTEILTQVEKAMDSFSPRDKIILKLKFGLNNEHCNYTNQEIGDMIGVSGSRVGMILNRLIERLRHPARFDNETWKTLKNDWEKIRKLQAQSIFP